MYFLAFDPADASRGTIAPRRTEYRRTATRGATMATMSGRDEGRKNGNGRGDPNRATLWAIVGTGVGLATLLLALASLFNARIDDVNFSLNARMDDMNARIDDLQEDIRELRALLIQALNESPPAD